MTAKQERRARKKALKEEARARRVEWNADAAAASLANHGSHVAVGVRAFDCARCLQHDPTCPREPRRLALHATADRHEYACLCGASDLT